MDNKIESDLIDYLERCQSRGDCSEEYKLLIRAYDEIRGLRGRQTIKTAHGLIFIDESAELTEEQIASITKAVSHEPK